MALDKILKIYDGDGNEVDYDILANDVKFQDGVDLPTKIAEMEEDISEAGTGNYTKPADGIPATDLDASVNESLDKADTAFQKPASGIPKTDLAQGVQDSLDAADSAYQKPASGIPSTDMTQAAQDALAAAGTAYQKPASGIPPTDLDQDVYDALAQAETALQPNDIATINNQSLTEGGNITIPPGDDGITPHIGANGNWWIGPETDPANDTGDPARGPQGAQGNVQVDGDGNVLIVNNLTDGGAGAALSGEMGLLIKHQVDSLYTSLNRLYTKLASMAFWDSADQSAAAPTALNWNVPQVTVSITNSIGAGAIIKDGDGNVVSGSLTIDKGSALTLTVEASSDDYELSNVAATVDGDSATVTNNSITISAVNANTAIVISGALTQVWFTVNVDDKMDGSTVETYGLQQGRSIFRETVSTYRGWACNALISNNTKPGTVLFPAGVPVSTKIFYNASMGSNEHSGSTAPSYIAVPQGVNYIHIKIIDPQFVYGPSYSNRDINEAEAALYSASKYRYNAAIAQYSSSVIGSTTSGTSAITGFISRGGYVSADDQSADLHIDGEQNFKFSLDNNAAYIKLLFCAFYNNQNDTQLATTDWLILQAANGKQPVTIKYKFTVD